MSWILCPRLSLLSPIVTKPFVSTRRLLTSKGLVYSEFGDPMKVVKLKDASIDALNDDEVIVRMLAAPVNPADINMIQGKYPYKVDLPAIAGNEGVGQIEEVGCDVENVRQGDRVVITKWAQGTWRQIAKLPSTSVKVIPESVGIPEAAMLKVNPCTAYRMLTDFIDVRKNKTAVIQNGGNSAVGQNVIQICHAWNVPTISVVREKPNHGELKCLLESLGATLVLTDKELSKGREILKSKQIVTPALGFNCVGGKMSGLLRCLGHSGTIVTYGGMSRQPVIIPTSAFIFKNVSFRGFWMTHYYKTASECDIDAMFAEVLDLMVQKKLKAPKHKMIKFDDYEEALQNTLNPKVSSGFKYILDFC